MQQTHEETNTDVNVRDSKYFEENNVRLSTRDWPETGLTGGGWVGPCLTSHPPHKLRRPTGEWDAGGLYFSNELAEDSEQNVTTAVHLWQGVSPVHP